MILQFPKYCVNWSFRSNARRANILVAVGFNPRLEMRSPLTEPRSGDILTTLLRRYAASGTGAIFFRGLNPTATNICALRARELLLFHRKQRNICK
jgi:hypothetical protein